MQGGGRAGGVMAAARGRSRAASFRRFSFRARDGLVLLLLVALVYGMSSVASTAIASRYDPAHIAISTDPRVLPSYALQSVTRIVIAYFVSLVFSLVYSYVAYRAAFAAQALLLVIDVLQSIPLLSFLPSAVLGLIALFPGKRVGVELAALLLLFTSMAWNMLLGFYQALMSIPRDLDEAAQVFRLSAWRRFWMLEAPAGAISLVWNSIISVAGGWFFLISIESFSLGGGRDFRLPGLGSFLAAAADRGEMRSVAWGLTAVVAVIVAVDWLIWRPLIVWSERFKYQTAVASASSASAKRSTPPKALQRGGAADGIAGGDRRRRERERSGIDRSVALQEQAAAAAAADGSWSSAFASSSTSSPSSSASSALEQAGRHASPSPSSSSASFSSAASASSSSSSSSSASSAPSPSSSAAASVQDAGPLPDEEEEEEVGDAMGMRHSGAVARSAVFDYFERSPLLRSARRRVFGPLWQAFLGLDRLMPGARRAKQAAATENAAATTASAGATCSSISSALLRGGRRLVNSRALQRLATAAFVGVLGYATYHAVLLLRALSLATWRALFIGALLTFARVTAALALSLLWTVPVGVAIGRSPRLSRALQPLVQVAASVPATALFPFLVLALANFGGSGLQIGSVALMMLGTMWYVLFNVIAGAQAIPEELWQVDAVYNKERRTLKRWRTLILPGIFPYLITGVVTAVGGAWNASIVSEYVQFRGTVLQTRGLGAMISAAAASGDLAVLLAGTLVMAALVLATNKFVWSPLYRLARERYSMLG